MVNRMTVGFARDLCLDLESFSAAEWARLYRHPSFTGFMGEYLTAKCLTSFWWHLRWGVYFRAWKHYDNGLHGRVAAWLNDWTRVRHGQTEPVNTKGLVMSRNLCKTQILLAWCGWKFAQDPNNRLLIRAYDQPAADLLGGAVARQLRTAKYRERYPWVQPLTKENSSQVEKWRGDEFMLQRDDEDVKVSSMQAMGVLGQPTGGHFQLGYYDDFEVDANANSDVEREVMFKAWRDDVNLYEAGSQKVIAGTPWSMLGLIYGILERCNGFEDHDIDLFRQPCTEDAFDRDFTGDSPELLGDRCTLRQFSAGLPTEMGGLETCAVTVRFFSPVTKDLVEEVREVVWNDGTHLRVNRPFPELLGQPLHFVVGREKPACPTRQTLDVVDWVPEFGGELPSVVQAHAKEPGVDGQLNGRFSLPKMLADQGSRIFSLQQRLEGVDAEALVYNSDDLQVVSWDQVPEGVKRWRRSCDFASAKQTAAASSFTTGFEMAHGFYLTHIAFEGLMGTTWKLLELVLGVKRVEALGGRLEWTSFEKSGHIEEIVGELLPDVCRDPHGFFTRYAGKRPGPGMPKYEQFVAEHFIPGQAVPVPIKWLPRTQSKNDRMAKPQPVVEAKKLFVLETCPHIETLRGCMDRFTMTSKEPFDLLDNLADLVLAGQLLKPAVTVAGVSRGRDDYHGVLRDLEAGMAEAVARGVNPGVPV